MKHLMILIFYCCLFIDIIYCEEDINKIINIAEEYIEKYEKLTKEYNDLYGKYQEYAKSEKDLEKTIELAEKYINLYETSVEEIKKLIKRNDKNRKEIKKLSFLVNNKKLNSLSLGCGAGINIEKQIKPAFILELMYMRKIKNILFDTQLGVGMYIDFTTPLNIYNINNLGLKVSISLSR